MNNENDYKHIKGIGRLKDYVVEKVMKENFLILLIIFFVVSVLILGTDHIKGIIVVFGFMIILIFVIFLLSLFTKNR